MNSVFVYDDVLLPEVRKLLGLAPTDEILAETTGKIYNIHREPIMLNVDDVARCRGCRRVYGAILYFDDADMEKVLYTLDSYKGCGESRIGKRHPYDLTYRSTIEVYPIICKDIHELSTFRYKFKRPVECYVYLGNPDHEHMIYNVKVDRHHKFTQGYYPKGFKNLLTRRGLLHE